MALLLLFVPATARGVDADGEASPAFATRLTASNLDAAAFAEQVAGREAPVSADEAKRGPADVVWTADGRIEWRGVRFGAGRESGPRHLRIGFRTPVRVGAVLVRGGGRLSVLKSGATAPGDLSDEAAWLPAERIVGGEVGTAEVDAEDYAVWTLPPGTETQALRFTHDAAPTETDPAGFLGGVWLLGDRFANIAPAAAVSASRRPEAAPLLTNESNDRTWRTWDNGEHGAESPVSPDRPEWIVLRWPAAVPLRGLGLLWTGFGAAQVEAFTGPDDVSPLEAAATDWRTVAASESLVCEYPLRLGPNWLDFGSTVRTRAVRLRITGPAEPKHPHVTGKVESGRRVWLGELLALSPLGDAPLASALPPQAEELPPPIPVRFTLPEPGGVTLVIEDSDGRRVRNLVSETPFPAGENVAWWDGGDDLGRDPDAAAHGLYHVPTRPVPPGEYVVRGLWRKPLRLVYEMSVYNAGDPPWETADGRGGWMTNHTPPTSVAFVPGERTADGEPLVFLGAYVSEGGHGLQWVREDGTKVGGQGRIGGVWTGAATLAVDNGPRADPNRLCYAGAIWEGELRLTAKTRSFADEELLKLRLGGDPKSSRQPNADRPPELEGFDGGDRRFVLGGLAARDRVLVGSLIRQNELLLVRLDDREQVRRLPVPDPRGVAFDRDGRLLVVSGTTVLRFPPLLVDALPATLGEPEIVVGSGLEDPRQVTVDRAGNLYVSDRGRSHQVKVFTADGKPLRTVGRPGVPATGVYDPRKMHNPNGIAIDGRGRLWVAEADFRPKRVSVWSPAGDFVRAFYGPTEYGGGGTLDPKDDTLFFYKGMEFRLDRPAGRDELVRVFHRPDGLLRGHYGDRSPDTPLYPASRPGDRYFTSCYTDSPTSGAAAAFLWKDGRETVRLVAGLGSAHDWDILKTPEFRPRWPAGVDPNGDRHRSRAVFAWADADGDGRPQPEEVAMIAADSGGVTVMNDLSFVLARLDGRAVRFSPAGFDGRGTPAYDLTAGETLVAGAQGPASSGGDQALFHPDGWTVLTNAPKPFSNHGPGGAFRGEPRWSYPSPWPGLHASHEAAVPDRPGMMVGHTRLLGGWIEPSRESGPAFLVNANMGNMFLMTADGLFVATLFHDVRTRPVWAMPTAVLGTDVSGLSLHDENFWPSVTQTADGTVHLVDGARTALVRIDGLDSIRRLPARPLRVTADDLARAADWYAAAEAARQRAAVREPLRVAIRKAAPTIDGSLGDWPDDAGWAVIDRRGTRATFNSDSRPYAVDAAVCIADGRLFAAFRTGDAELLRNAGGDANALFKTGGGLDLMLGTDPNADPGRTEPVAGDLRLLVTVVDGRPQAVLYRPVATKDRDPVGFSSPWRTVTFDSVKDVTADLAFAAGKGGAFEFSVPLTVLGWSPQADAAYSGDLGLLRGNGFQTLQRVYWSNKATAITSDVPSEAALTPRLWGTWQVIPDR